MSEKKELRQAENVAKIEGIVADIRIETKEVNGKPAISGEIDILVGEDTHTVNVFSYKKNGEGKESGLYKGFVTVMNDYKSIKAHGKDAADKVRITQGQIDLNDYYGADGLLRSFPQLKTNFVNRLQSGDTFEPKAEFTLEMVIAVVKEEMKDNEATGRAIIKGYVPVYGNKVIPFDVVVAEKKAVDYVTSNYEKGTTVTVHGEIVNKKVLTTKEVEVEFGDPKVDTSERTVREYSVKGGTAPKDQEDVKAYKVADIKKGLEEREKMLAEKKEKAAKKDSNNSSSNKSKDPFGDSEAFGKPIDISDDDLPF
jgi:single-stranded DNA-binding protein